MSGLQYASVSLAPPVRLKVQLCQNPGLPKQNEHASSACERYLIGVCYGGVQSSAPAVRVAQHPQYESHSVDLLLHWF